MAANGGMNILVTGARAPVALHLARLFNGGGHRVLLADGFRYPLSSHGKACDRYIRLPSPRFEFEVYRAAIEDLVRRERVDLVVPTCEEVFYLGRVFQERTGPGHTFAPPRDLLRKVHDKFAFIELMRSFGANVPETRLVERTEEIGRYGDDAGSLVFKPVWSRFASDALIRPSRKQLDKAARGAVRPWVAQEYVDGDEISVYCVAREGRLCAFSAYRSLYRAGRGAGICFAPVRDDRVRLFAETFLAYTKWTGQVSFDLIRRPDGEVLPIECNPRSTSGLHFFRDPRSFCEAVLGGGPEVVPDETRPQMVPLAMWIYGLPAAIRSGSFARFRQIYSEAANLLAWPDDLGPIRQQWLTLGEIAVIALRNRISLQAASTRDIEWNGPDGDHNSIS